MVTNVTKMLLLMGFGVIIMTLASRISRFNLRLRLGFMSKKLICLMALPFSCSALATEEPLSPYWYAGIGFGQGYYSNGGNPLSYDSVRNRFAGTAYLGYQVNPYLSSELNYQYLGSAYAKYAQGDIQGDVNGYFQQITLAARLGYPLTQSLYPYIKLGGAGWFGESEGLRSGSEQGFSPIVGMGIEYAFSTRLSGRLEYQYTDSLGTESIGYTDHHLTTLGLTWRFGFSSPATSSKIVAPSVPPAETHIAVVPAPDMAPKKTIERRTFVASEQKNNNVFAHNSTVLENKTAFSEAVSFLQAHPSSTAKVAGHTDSSGSEKYNQLLSERRAQAVANYLISMGIDAARLTVVGYGEQHPVADNTQESGRAMNRRVEIIIPEFMVSQSKTEK